MGTLWWVQPAYQKYSWNKKRYLFFMLLPVCPPIQRRFSVKAIAFGKSLQFAKDKSLLFFRNTLTLLTTFTRVYCEDLSDTSADDRRLTPLVEASDSETSSCWTTYRYTTMNHNPDPAEQAWLWHPILVTRTGPSGSSWNQNIPRFSLYFQLTPNDGTNLTHPLLSL